MSNRVKFISYDGKYPNLCSGVLVLEVDGIEYIFDKHSISSGGTVWFGDNWEEHVESGPWYIGEWPEGFPQDLHQEAVDIVNDNVSEGCCGGCV